MRYGITINYTESTATDDNDGVELLERDDLKVGDIVTLPPVCEHTGDDNWLHGVPLQVVSLQQDMMGNIQLRVQEGQRERFLAAAEAAGCIALYGVEEVLDCYPDDGSGISVSAVVRLDDAQGGQ